MPNAGNENIEASEQSPVRTAYSKIALSEEGTFTSVWWYLHTNGIEIDVQAALYDHDGGSPGDPDNLLEVTSIRTLNVSSGSPDWYEFDLDSPVIASIADYWVGMSGDGTSNSLRWFSGSTGNLHFSGSNPSPRFEDPAQVSIRQTVVASAYATYSTGSVLTPTLTLLGVGS